MVLVKSEAGNDVTGKIAVVLMTSQGACSVSHRDNKCCFSDVTGGM